MKVGHLGRGQGGKSAKATPRWWTCLVIGAGLALGQSSASAQVPGDAAPPIQAPRASTAPLALGLIVKLKDKQPASVVRLPASVRPSDGAQAQRLRIAAAASRKRVSYLVQKPTAYGAQLIHHGRYTTLAEAEAEAAKLRLDPEVEWVVVNQMERPAAVAVPFSVSPAAANAYASHKWMQRRVTAGSEVGVGPGVADFRKAWDTLFASGRTLSPVVVAVLDTGKLSHPDLSLVTEGGRVLPGYDFVSEVEFARDGTSLDADPTDPGDYLLQSEINANPALYGSACKAGNSSWHGTSVMSMLTPSVGSTTMGPAALSMLPESVGQVLPVRIGGTCGALVSDIIEGMLWAAGVDYQGSPTPNPKPARVINLSFGGSGTCQSGNRGDVLYRQTVSLLRTKGTLVVASAGNGDNETGVAGYVGPTRPASCPGVMAVTAVRYDGSKAAYANTVAARPADGYRGIAVAGGDLINSNLAESLNLLTNRGTRQATTSALENDICSGGSCSFSEGTSFAAPQVAAVAALVLSVAPGLDVDGLVNLLLTSATPHQAVNGAASCEASLASGSVSNCSCTEATCGAGVLDADAALVQALALPPSTAFNPPSVYATEFKPDRLISSSKGSGGGGATDDVALWALLAAAAVLGIRGRRDAGASS